MRWWKHIPIVVLALATFAAAQEARQAPPDQQQSFARRDRKGGSGERGGRQHAGAWLKQYAKMSPEEQERALAGDPEFQQLPPERQQKLRQRLQEFNNLPQERKERILRNMDYMEHLSPDQKEKMRGYFQQFRAMPQERRRMVKRALKSLREMSPEERERVFRSEKFGQNFSKQEIELMRGMSELTPPGGDGPDAQRRGEERRDPREDMLNPQLPPDQATKPRDQ